MSQFTNLDLNMSSNMVFPTEKDFINFPFANMINSSIKTNTSSPISSRSSTPPSESSYTSQSTCTSNNSNISMSNNLSYENHRLRCENTALNMENISLKLEISKLKADISINTLNNEIIDEKNYYLSEYNRYKSLYNKINKKKDELKKLLDEERKKKRKYVHILYEFGLSNESIRKDMGDYEYSAEIRNYAISKVTKLRNDIKQYGVGDRVGRKCFEFTNSSNLSLNINDLKIVNVNNPNENIRYSIQKLDSSVGCIYDDDDNNNKHNDYQYCHKSNSYNSRNGDRCGNNNNIINPDDHFLIRFEHPIVQKEGSYKLSYRLFSKIKANTRRYKGNGTFGQKINFEYQVSNYY